MTGERIQEAAGEGARAVQGLSAGADLVLVGSGDPQPLTRTLAAVGVDGPVTVATGALRDQLLTVAEVAGSRDDATLVVADSDLQISVPALLDLLDRPGVSTAALVADPAALTGDRTVASLARVGRDRRLVESVGTPAHTVSGPTDVLPGILRIAAPDRARTATLVREAAAGTTPRWGGDAAAVTTLALVRGGVDVHASHLGPFDWARGTQRARGAPGGPWEQRLRGASRGGDGFFSTFAVRPLSRRLTAVGLSRGWAPNSVTVASLGCGLLAALLVATGLWWAWVVAAVLLLVALVVDCVDGEIARYTRRFSAFGAFLDAVGDRVKEYSVLAAVAVVAVRHGDPGWPVAIAAMAAVTVRHLEDYAYEERIRHSRRSAPDLLPVTAPRDLGPAEARTALPDAPSRREQAWHWARKVVHMPIAERYLLIAVTLLTGRPMLVLWALFVAVVVAVVWTQGGRVAAVLLRRDPTWAAVPRARVRGHLDEQLDLGPLAVAVGRLGGASFDLAIVGLVVLVAGPPLALWRDLPWVALGAAAVAAVLVGLGSRAPVHHPLGWQGPAATWVAEALTVGVLVHHTLGVASAAGFAYLAAVAYHHYDVVYRLRDTGEAPARSVRFAGLGTDGRVLLLLLVAALAPGAALPALWAGAGALAVLFVGESARAWRAWMVRS